MKQFLHWNLIIFSVNMKHNFFIYRCFNFKNEALLLNSAWPHPVSCCCRHIGGHIKLAAVLCYVMKILPKAVPTFFNSKKFSRDFQTSMPFFLQFIFKETRIGPPSKFQGKFKYETLTRFWHIFFPCARMCNHFIDDIITNNFNPINRIPCIYPNLHVSTRI